MEFSSACEHLGQKKLCFSLINRSKQQERNGGRGRKGGGERDEGREEGGEERRMEARQAGRKCQESLQRLVLFLMPLSLQASATRGEGIVTP